MTEGEGHGLLELRLVFMHRGWRAVAEGSLAGRRLLYSTRPGTSHIPSFTNIHLRLRSRFDLRPEQSGRKGCLWSEELTSPCLALHREHLAASGLRGGDGRMEPLGGGCP